MITAVNESELPTLEALYKNGLANGVKLEMLDARAARKLEPNVQSVGAVFSPFTGVLSAHALMDYFFHTAIANGATVQHRCEVVEIEPTSGGYAITLSENGTRSTFTSERVINAAGLNADSVAAMVGIRVDAAGYRQYYAKGSYFSVVPAKWKLVSRLVYPVPRDEGLGVHAVIDVGGRLRFGPDVEYLPGREFDYSVDEGKQSRFAESIQRLIPAIGPHDLAPDFCGVRPKLQRKGEPRRDFIIVHEKERGLLGFVNLLGIDSPGLTCSPAIARYVEELLE
jgi:L-2-hydroxyglutarate oxidase LhgO